LLNAWITPKDSPLQNTFFEKQKAANLGRKLQWLQTIGDRLSVAVICFGNNSAVELCDSSGLDCQTVESSI